MNLVCAGAQPASIVLIGAPVRYEVDGPYNGASQTLTPTGGPVSRFAFLKAVLGPLMRLMFRPRVEGAEGIPGSGR
ncbi:hypothetical protein GCM10017744_024840 [Streptomyces antimycoticus]